MVSSSSKIVVTTTRRIPSTVDLPLLPTCDMLPDVLPSCSVSSENDSRDDCNSNDVGYFKLSSRIVSSSNSLASSIDTVTHSISQPTTPIATTPVDCTIIPAIKNVHSLDQEMRSRKRIRRSVSGGYTVNYPSPTMSLIDRISLPLLIPLEDCCDSNEVCLPDISFLAQKKTLLRRSRFII